MRKCIKFLALCMLVFGILLSAAGCQSDHKKPVMGDFPDPGEDSLDGTYRC